MVNLLLEHKSPLNATDISGYTGLHHGEYPLPSPYLFLGQYRFGEKKQKEDEG